ncbi:hypothetical protein [Yoonia sp. SDW83-1]|uniref:hypothetical protein n=1 Tax=Yoonia sp. SDW83-1 TaxID=3366945 RepID=UPI00398C5D35
MRVKIGAHDLSQALRRIGTVSDHVLIDAGQSVLLKASDDFVEAHVRAYGDVRATGCAYVNRDRLCRIIAGCHGTVIMGMTDDRLSISASSVSAALPVRDRLLYHSYGVAGEKTDTGLTFKQIRDLHRFAPHIEGWDNVSVRDGAAYIRFSGGLFADCQGGFAGGGAIPLTAVRRLTDFDPNATLSISESAWQFTGPDCAASGMTILGKVEDWRRIHVAGNWVMEFEQARFLRALKVVSGAGGERCALISRDGRLFLTALAEPGVEYTAETEIDAHVRRGGFQVFSPGALAKAMNFLGDCVIHIRDTVGGLQCNAVGTKRVAFLTNQRHHQHSVEVAA